MNQLQAIKAFARVVEMGSFTRAADSLDIPNATLSKMVKELENHLGTRLLQRTTRRVTVTPEGQDYYQQTSRVINDLEDIDSALNATHSKPRGKLRIDIGSSTATDILIPALPDFIALYPDITLELGVSDHSIDLIGNHVDCVIRGGNLNDSSLIARALGHAEMITCVSPAYLKLYGVPAYPDELKNGHRLVSYVTHHNSRAVPFKFMQDGELIEIKAEQRFNVNESNAHLAAAVAGIGIIQTFTYCAAAGLKTGELIEILHDWRPPVYPFHVVYPQNRHMTQRLRVFIDWLVTQFPPRLNGTRAK